VSAALLSSASWEWVAFGAAWAAATVTQGRSAMGADLDVATALVEDRVEEGGLEGEHGRSFSWVLRH
jgi:hypothetical protein